MSTVAIILSAIVFFVASFVKGTTGFGFGLLALPLLLLFLPPSTAIPLVLGLAFTNEIMLLFSIRGCVKVKRIIPLVLGGVLGVPFGYYLLNKFPEDDMSLVISLLIVVIGILILTDRLSRIPGNAIARFLVGAFSGVVHGVSSLAGPFLASYLDGAKERKEEFRADMIIATCVLTFTALIFFGKGGYVTTDLLTSWLILLPFILFGALLGIKMEHRTRQEKFHLAVMSMVIAAGALSLFSQLLNMFG